MAARSSERYAQAIQESKGATFLPVVVQLLDAKVCLRCCLRHAGRRGDIYAPAAPQVPELLSRLRASTDADPSHSSIAHQAAPAPAAEAEPEGAANASLLGPTDAARPEHETFSPTNGAEHTSAAPCKASAKSSAAQNGQHGAAAEGHGSQDSKTAPCSVCLGALQCLDSLQPATPSDGVTAAVQQWDSSSNRAWQPLASCTARDIAAHVRALGYAGHAFRLELVLPGAIQVRQQALWHWLRRTESTRALFPGHSPAVDIVSVREALQSAVAPVLSAGLGKTLQEGADLCVAIMILQPACAAEADFLFGVKPRKRGTKRRKGQETIQVGKMASDNLAQLAARMMESVFGNHSRIPPLAPVQAPYAFLSCTRDPLLVAGYYRKLTRDISHTPFFVDGQRLGKTSIQEILEELLQTDLHFRSAKLISAGREDLDVRMLGNGRPFVLEVADARSEMPSQERLQALQEQLRSSGVGVEVLQLQAAPKSVLKAIKDGEGEKQKSYLARCRLPCPVTDDMLQQLAAMKDLVLKQTTPTRVEQRRAMLVREKTVHEMRAERVADDANGLLLHLRTQAGTYIKEFVHSDEGRTAPSLGTLLGCTVPAQILELDVLEIHMPFLEGS